MQSRNKREGYYLGKSFRFTLGDYGYTASGTKVKHVRTNKREFSLRMFFKLMKELGE